MLQNFVNVFRVKDLRNKVLFTLLMVGIYQLGSNIPVPGVSYSAIHQLVTQSRGAGIFGFLDLFSGGALSRAALFGLGIMPYITSSIIIQLLTGVIPKLTEWRDQGSAGERKITQTTRYLTIGLALLQATGLAFVFHSGLGILLANQKALDLIPDFTVPRVLFIVLTLTAGTALVMWMAESITERGVGQGMSILIFANVVSIIPSGGRLIYDQAGALKFTVIVLVVLLLLVAIVFVEQGQRRIPVVFARRVVGRRMYEGGNSYIPLKVNQAGVIPIIFASSILYFPVLLSNVIPVTSFRTFVNNHLLNATSGFYIITYGLLIIVFTFFYVTVAFDPYQQAEVIRKQNGYIPGVRPGQPTQQYLSRILNRITLPGALFLAAIAVIPSILLSAWHITSFPYAGTTILIAVIVALETVKQINSQLTMRNYKGFLK
ncbi:MAG: preprotein translocase subunit SecY [Ferrimicrobium sp.]|uniref:Protein translocase subunit SecY n=1 Tax=Ferrimicrobium acidiphilum TaxID=121039 RepID=A0ABV3XYY0_9ACTN|nr:preprotein translocase subunit SecY [Ferrimicrobium sp.]MCL5973065.1 preprotein translocase subunit SecY [Actinomycetota bacterium]